MSVRTYNPSVRVGNWNEDLCLEEDLLKDFLDKKERGELLIQKTTNLLQTILKEIKLSQSSDGFLHIGDKVCLLHNPTQTLLSVNMSAAKAYDAKHLLSGSGVACSKNLQPCVRSVFVIGSYEDSSCKPGDVVRYDQKITLTTLPDEGGQLSLESDRATFIQQSKFSREQELTLRDEISHKSAWKLLCFNQADRLEKEGTPVPANTLLFINHSKTNQHLCLHTEWMHRTPFGREYEVTVCTKFNTHKAEDTHNHFMIIAGDPRELVGACDQAESK